VLRGRGPSAVAVLLEDGAAVTGVILAATALGLSHITGNSFYDAIGSMTIIGTASVSVNILIMQFMCPIINLSLHLDIKNCNAIDIICCVQYEIHFIYDLLL